MRADAVVLGAGIVGVSVALHLQKRGRATVLVDRRAPGEETSFGNAGLIQREAVSPYGFPRDIGSILRHALNSGDRAHYHWRALGHVLPFLARYWWHSHPERHRAIAKLYAPLIERCIEEHLPLARRPGAEALLHHRGWIKLYRTQAALDVCFAEAEIRRREYGVGAVELDRAALAAKEPHLDGGLVGGLHYTDPVAVDDPHALTLAYARLFERLGGRLLRGDATSLEANASGWRVSTEAGPLEAGAGVVALGAWADAVTRPLGYRLPLAVKRGYHMHYRPKGNAVLNHTVLDDERGYVLAPMAKGIRLTTGAEFAHRDAGRTPVQLARAEPVARSLFPLGERIDPEPWMGFAPARRT
jgi:D-amino-acid dehydrogenase